MTKPNTKPCLCCTHYHNAIPCDKGHHPRFYKDKGLRRVCDDFGLATKDEPKKSVGFPWLDAFFSIFGTRRV